MNTSQNSERPVGSPVANTVTSLTDTQTLRALLALLRTGPLVVVCLLVLTVVS